MRTCLPTLLLFTLLAAPAQAQTCRKVPPPFLPGLFPQEVLGMPLEFVTDPAGGCTAWYRPASESQRADRPWAVVAVEANRDQALGEDAAAARTRFTAPTYTLLTMAGWPVALRAAPLGEEFSAHKGSVHVVVLVKNGDQGATSQALATAVMEAILPKVPCGG